ncbi:MAG: signal peptidase I [Clostridia bacterium]|nr:signal peptidase I [Clostridia bacterium]
MINQISEQQNNEKKGKGKAFTIICWTLIAVLTLVLCFLVYTNVFCMKISVEGSSMSPTLESGDEIIASKYKKAKGGDVVVISGEKKGELIIKRVIAVGGQTVKIENGLVYVDGEAISEPYLKEQASTEAHLWNGEITIKDNEVFFLGDNRAVSEDSRSGYGTCSVDQIVGVVPDWAISTKGFLKIFI